jgi:hypothetical protein
MFGLEILDVVIGLMFVYLLLSLLATAINEYLSAVMNLRGKELARGLGRLLDDLDEKDALKTAFDGVSDRATASTARLTEQFYNHPLIRQLTTRRGLLFRGFSQEPRLPSYIPARTFAQALLDVLGVKEKDANLNALLPATGSTPPTTSTPAVPEKAKADAKANLARVLHILRREAPLDVTEHIGELKGWLENANLPADAKLRLLEGLTSSQTQLQKLHDSVEVWFNNSMDRVSGAYKRTIQGWLFIIGLLIAVWMNADTIDMWRRLEADDELRNAMVRRAEATVAALDTTLADSAVAAQSDPGPDAVPPSTARTDSPAVAPPPVAAPSSAAGDTTVSDSAKLAAVRQARANYLASRARLDSMELKLGWTREEAMRIGWTRADTSYKGTPPRRAPFNGPFWGKIFGLLLTALAISLGAPFWFDLLNKVISIRGAGRSPEERPKSPEGGPKRIAERAPK